MRMEEESNRKYLEWLESIINEEEEDEYEII